MQFLSNLFSPLYATIFLLLIANVFMNLAWYMHLKLQTVGISSNWPVWVVILFSWGIALIEYCFMIPANRLGYVENGGPYTLVQLKVIQEALTLFVFVLFTMVLFNGESLKWNHFLAFALIIAAVYLVFMK